MSQEKQQEPLGSHVRENPYHQVCCLASWKHTMEVLLLHNPKKKTTPSELEPKSTKYQTYYIKKLQNELYSYSTQNRFTNPNIRIMPEPIKKHKLNYEASSNIWALQTKIQAKKKKTIFTIIEEFMSRNTWNATFVKAIAATTPNSATLIRLIFLVIGNHSRNPLDLQHHSFFLFSQNNQTTPTNRIYLRFTDRKNLGTIFELKTETTKKLKKKEEVGRHGTTTGEEKEVGRTSSFGRQSTTPAVRRRVALNYTTLTSDSPDMNEWPWNSVYSRDVYNSSNLGITPKRKPNTNLPSFSKRIAPGLRIRSKGGSRRRIGQVGLCLWWWFQRPRWGIVI